MKKALLLLPLLGITSAARADVSWEHRGTVSIGDSKPLVYFSMKNDWSNQKHRTSFLFDATKAMSMAVPMNSKPVKGESQVIERLDDDRFIVVSNQTKTYIDEPLKSLKSRLRLNFWEALGSDLSATDVPELTPEQRQRLGREIRAVVTPFTKKVVKNYFRALPEKRTINGLNSRGYRFTSMVNVSGKKEGQEWVRFAAEWWLADEQASDEEIRTFTQSVNKIKMDGGGPTASMWINEMAPVYWEAAPVEMHQALASIVGEPNSPGFGFQGTPVQFHMTITPPPAEAMGIGGDIRVSMDLAKRDTASVDESVFEAPKGYEKIAIEPFIGMAQNFIKMGKGELDKMLDY